LKWWVVFFLASLWLCVLGTWTWEISGHPIDNPSWDTFLIAGYAKCAITFVKYCPQVYLNYARKSTVGWSLANVLLDLTGGVLSMAQIFLNAWALGEPVIGEGAFNLVKFVLSVMCIFFDTIFLI
jgi:cystinosin